jgi:hypothetical protein
MKILILAVVMVFSLEIAMNSNADAKTGVLDNSKPKEEFIQGENILMVRLKDGEKTPYWLNAGKVFYRNVALSGADPESFQYFEDSFFAFDKFKVYYRGEVVEKANPKTFTVLENGSSYGKDSDYVFLGNNIINGAQVDFFQILDKRESISKDGKQLYKGADIIPLNMEHFEYLDGGIMKDQSKVLRVTNEDEKCIFKEVSGVDPKTLEPLYYGYFKDKNRIYYNYLIDGLKPLTNCDLKTFTVLKSGEAKDKNTKWKDGEIVK